ncbi:MAG: DUF427 domain-containing protein [Nisaea sp.]|uniref:DUF427 domain-containing protein n=1 Tax=Nisaea sp. TaxID=2024842 RepID=UPI001B1DFE43|nr:DUF427 domain-containing protein [Nisaea sp.]MBO6561725.1 DUF427 domain-containing protein [Nisaea sp.]
MSATETRPAPAPVDGAIRNPSNPDHFMVLQPVKRRARVYFGNTLVADSRDALRVIEIGTRAYEPRLYFPPSAIKVPLEQLEKATHCPLKGEADYFALDGREIGWAYRAYDFAAPLDGLTSFWGDGMRIVEGD